MECSTLIRYEETTLNVILIKYRSKPPDDSHFNPLDDKYTLDYNPYACESLNRGTVMTCSDSGDIQHSEIWLYT